MPVTLTYGFTAFKEIEDYLKEKNVEGYDFIICDSLSGEDYVKLDVSKEDLIKALRIVTSMEHDYPNWIGISKKRQSVIIGLLFTRGNLSTGKTYTLTNGQLVKKDEVQN